MPHRCAWTHRTLRIYGGTAERARAACRIPLHPVLQGKKAAAQTPPPRATHHGRLVAAARGQASLEAFSEEQRRIPCGPGDGSEWDSVKWPKEPQPVDEDSCEPDLLPLNLQADATATTVAVEIEGAWRTV